MKAAGFRGLFGRIYYPKPVLANQKALFLAEKHFMFFGYSVGPNWREFNFKQPTSFVVGKLCLNSASASQRKAFGTAVSRTKIAHRDCCCADSNFASL